jgi:hypothetical protein
VYANDPFTIRIRIDDAVATCVWGEALKGNGVIGLRWPNGYAYDRALAAVVAPDGRVVARDGETINGLGSVSETNLATPCRRFDSTVLVQAPQPASG